MKALKIAAVAVGVVIVAVIGLAFAGIPAGFLIGQFQSQIEDKTGYQLKIFGSSTLRILPVASLTVNGLSFMDMRSGGPQTGFTAESVRVEASLKNLFADRPQINEIVVTKPEFRAPLHRQRTAGAPAGAPAGAKKSPPAVTIDHFAIHDGTLLFVDPRNQVKNKLERIELIGSLAATQAVDVLATARSGEQELRLKIGGKVPAGSPEGQSIPISFAFEAPGLLRTPLTGTFDVKPVGKLIQFNNVNGTLGVNRFSGWASVDATSKPLVKVDLDFQSVDLGAAHTPGAGSGGPANIDQSWSTAPIDLDGLNYLDAEVHVSATALNVDTFHVAPIALDATIQDGIVRAALPQVGLYSGAASAGIAIDVTRPDHGYALRLNLAGVRALPLLTDIANFTALDGIMQSQIDLRAHGANQRTIMSSLEGTMDLLFQNGEIRSLNIAQMIRNVAATILTGWQSASSEKTDFAQFSGLFRFDKGQATTDNLQLVGPLVRVTGAGTADVGAKTLNFRLEPKLVASLQGQGSTGNPIGLGVPVMVQGTWGAPKIYPELAGILDNPDAAFTKLKELGLGLFGGGAGAQSGTQPGQPGAQPGGQTGTQPGTSPLLQGLGEMMKSFGNPPAANPAPAPRR
jgi:AsmA protein